MWIRSGAGALEGMMMDATEAGLALVDKFADKLTGIIKDYGPDAMNFALEIGRIGAIKEVLISIAVLAAGVVLCNTAWTCGRKGIDDGIMSEGHIFGCMISATAGVPTLAAGIYWSLNLYAWVGMFHPEVYLAAKAMGL